MLQKFRRKPQQHHSMRLKAVWLTVIFWGIVFVEALLLPMAALSEGEGVYPEGDQEYFKALIELEKEKENIKARFMRLK